MIPYTLYTVHMIITQVRKQSQNRAKDNITEKKKSDKPNTCTSNQSTHQVIWHHFTLLAKPSASENVHFWSSNRNAVRSGCSLAVLAKAWWTPSRFLSWALTWRFILRSTITALQKKNRIRSHQYTPIHVHVLASMQTEWNLSYAGLPKPFESYLCTSSIYFFRSTNIA